MTTLFDATLALARILMRVHQGDASANGAAGKTTLVDTTRVEPNDFYHLTGAGGGVIWFLSGTNDELSRAITNWVNATGTFTFAAVTAQTVTGDDYAVCPIDWSRDELIEAINAARQTIGSVPAEDESLVTVADQMDYDLPSGVYNVLRVEEAQSTSSPYLYVPHSHWEEIGGKISFDEDTQPKTTDYKIRLTYSVAPTDLTTDAGTISDYVHIDLLKWVAAVHALRRRRGDPEFTGLLNEALKREEEMKILHPIPEMDRDPHLSGWMI